MTITRSSVLCILRLMALAATLGSSLAHADEYADVSQLLRAGKLTEAMSKADQYLLTKPRDPQMRFLKGVIQRDAGKPADAITTFTKLTEDYPELPEPYNNLAVLYAGQSQFDKARTALEMAVRTNPSYATAHENLGDVYAKLASQAYNKALQLDSSNSGVPPKLALIRELFNPGLAKGVRPTMSPSPATSPTVSVATSLPLPPVKPPPTLPVQAVSKPQPVVVAAASVSAVSSAAPTPPPAASPVALPASTAPAPAATPVAATRPAVKASTSAAGESGSPAAAKDAKDTKDAEAAVHAWAKAWAAKDLKVYFAAYGKDFVPSGSLSRNAWESERRDRINGKASISVKLENLKISVEGHNKAVARFRQDYKAGGLAVSSRKALDLVKVGERWLIVKESTGS